MRHPIARSTRTIRKSLCLLFYALSRAIRRNIHMTLAALFISLAALGAALALGRIQRRRRIRAESAPLIMRSLQDRIAARDAELERERMRVVACGLATLGAHRATRVAQHSAYWSPSYEDVCKLADRAALLAPQGIERMLAECVPGGSTCDPQVIADNIRNYFATKGLSLFQHE